MFNGDRVSIWEDDKVLKVGGRDVNVSALMPVSCVLVKVVKMVNSMVCVFYHTRKVERAIVSGEKDFLKISV